MPCAPPLPRLHCPDFDATTKRPHSAQHGIARSLLPRRLHRSASRARALPRLLPLHLLRGARAPPRVDPHHVLAVRAGQHVHVRGRVNGEGVVEGAARTRGAVRHVAHLAVNADVHARAAGGGWGGRFVRRGAAVVILAGRGGALAVADGGCCVRLGEAAAATVAVAVVVVVVVVAVVDERRIRVRDVRRQVQDAADGDRLAKGAGIGVQEDGARVCEAGGAAERELERGFEQEAAEDHEAVSVAVLRLHDARRLQARCRHAQRASRRAPRVAWVVVREGAVPQPVAERRFRGVGGCGEQGGAREGFLGDGARRAAREEGVFVRRGGRDGGDGHGPARGRVEGDHCEGAGEQDVCRVEDCDVVVFRAGFIGDGVAGTGFGDGAGDLHAAAAGGIGDAARVAQVAQVDERARNDDAVEGGGDGRDARPGMLVCDDAGQGVEVHEDGAEPDVPCAVEVRVG